MVGWAVPVSLNGFRFLKIRNMPAVIIATLMVSNPQVSSRVMTIFSVGSLCKKPKAVMA